MGSSDEDNADRCLTTCGFWTQRTSRLLVVIETRHDVVGSTTYAVRRRCVLPKHRGDHRFESPDGRQVAVTTVPA